jgi:hypothetical protein
MIRYNKFPGLLFLGSLIFCPYAKSQELTNKGGSISISSGSTVTVSGAVSSINTATIVNNGTFQTSGNWDHDGTLLYSGTGTLELNGSGAQQLTATTLYNLLISGAGTKTASSAFTVNNDLGFQVGSSATLVTTSSNPVTLGSTGTLSETAIGYIDGWIQTNRTIGQGIAQSFGGLGLQVTANGAAPGSTTLLRGTGISAIQSGSGSLGIARVYTVTPATNTGLNADVVFAYRDGELNALSEATLILFGSSDGGNTWSWLGQVGRDASANTLVMNGINSFGRLTLGAASSPLPLNWITFTGQAQDRGNNLQWVVANENNTAYFGIERSADSRRFETIGRATAAGFSSGDRSYQFLDPTTKGNWYYRLRQVDLDGHFTYSGIVRLMRSGQATLTADAFPNPFTNTVTLRLSRIAEKDIEGSVQFLDAIGRIVFRQEWHLAAGQSEIPINGVGGLPAGTYFLRLSMADGSQLLVRLQH